MYRGECAMSGKYSTLGWCTSRRDAHITTKEAAKAAPSTHGHIEERAVRGKVVGYVG